MWMKYCDFRFAPQALLSLLVLNSRTDLKINEQKNSHYFYKRMRFYINSIGLFLILNPVPSVNLFKRYNRNNISIQKGHKAVHWCK